MMPNDLPRMQVLITTQEQYIEGELILPENMRFSNTVPDNMLFYILNGGFQFITLKNCEIKDRKNIAFRADKCPQLHVNIAGIMTMQIIEILPDDFEYGDEDVYNAGDDEEEFIEKKQQRAVRRK